ncbi:twin-arginine translocation signal domain-containing protein [Microbacterium sp. NPDC064584]|uniref:twin-arginine translocation signal domain-containing protein n=1 Tax=Microbacterium sp. NPDC064584 TaxID=3155817 RepID=UPI00343CF9E1
MSDKAPRPSTSRRRFLQTLSAGTVGAALSGALLSQPAQAAVVRTLAGDGVTDDAPGIQAAFDAGTLPVFEPNRTYFLNSPIFLDRAPWTTMYVLDLNGATLLLGPNLPTTDAFYREPAVKWAIFPNTKRTAFANGKVDVSLASRASGQNTGALISLIVRNGTVDGNGANVGFAFANRTALRFETVILRRARTLLSWFDYCDANVFLQCHNRGGGPSSSVLVEQIASGDGLLMQSCKADSTVGMARLKYCRGAEIVSTVTGRVEVDSCSAVIIRGGHQETPLANETMIDVKSSEVVIDTTALYLARASVGTTLPPAVRIRDYGTVPSSVTLRDCIEMRALLDSDDQLGALVSIETPIAGTRVEARGLTSMVSVRSIGGVWDSSPGPHVAGVSGVATAVVASRAAIASGDFEVSNPGGGWQVRQTTVPGTAAKGTPSVVVSTPVGGLVGTLTSAKKRYRLQALMPDGTFTSASAYTSAVAPSGGTLLLVVTTKGGPQALRIWRYAGTSTTAEAYLELPAGQPSQTLYDTGAALSGFAWLPGNSAAVR